MIVLKELRWSNAFSYGPDNSLSFVASPLVQLVGKNGHGKSSVALILEEVLFNKNSKGIKKADIANRYLEAKGYSIELDFEKDGVGYTIKTNRTSTQTVKLLQGTKDVSAHTATATYKIIEDLIGIDHKTFCQIVYQSHASSLEFLTATDSNRKKFLIELLNLGKYTRAQEVFKELTSEVTKQATAAESRIKTIQTWLNKYKLTDFTPREYEVAEHTEVPTELLTQVAGLQADIANIKSTNTKIKNNLIYKQKLKAVQAIPSAEAPSQDGEKISAEISKLDQVSASARAFIKKMQTLRGTCATCLQHIDESTVSAIVAERQQELTKAETEQQTLREALAAYKAQKTLWDTYKTAQQEQQQYTQLVDATLPDVEVTVDDLRTKVDDINSSIEAIKQSIAKVAAKNKEVDVYNSKLSTIREQLDEFEAELVVASGSLYELNKQLNTLAVLNKTFSNNGLVAYKIEVLVKDLEMLANQYLVELSDGRFQIGFEVSVSDKLNVVITDNGKNIDMLALSGGERARVNVATLLAIRKLMQGLSSSRINLLILDETIENLDVEGKEKLIEVLLNEESLNTLVVSHGFTHPLLDKVQVVKTNNISRIEV
jgi:DNA repair exonuclease SbcCD ATPase subunit